MTQRLPLLHLRLVGVCLFCVLVAAAEGGRLRIMGGNITSGNGQSYDPGHGARIFQGLDPDVVLIQEFNFGTNSVADIRRFVTTTFGAGFSYFREAGAQIPNGVISRYPILSSGEWDDPAVANRDFSWARIDLPGDKDLWAVSVHFLTSSATNRNTEARALVGFIQANVPEGDYLVIGGDFNSDNRSESQFATLGTVVYTGAPHPVDGSGNPNTNAGRSKPYDSVFADGDLRAHQKPVVIGSGAGASTFTNGLVVDTRAFNPISQISPALTSDSAATGMQHMAIVKDFLLPEPLVITSSPTLAPGTVGQAYGVDFRATGGSASYGWSLAAGAPPPGLTLGASGSLVGTPTTAGSFGFTVRVADGAGATASATFTCVVKEPFEVFLASNGLPADSAKEDPDLDGLANLLEFLLGGNPRGADPALRPAVALSPDGSTSVFGFSVVASPGAVTWKVQTSTDFTLWKDVVSGQGGALITNAPEGGARRRISVSMPAGGGSRFFRLFATTPAP